MANRRLIVLIGNFEPAPPQLFDVATVKWYPGSNFCKHDPGLPDEPDLVVISSRCPLAANNLGIAYAKRTKALSIYHCSTWKEVAHGLRRKKGAHWIYRAVFKLDPPTAKALAREEQMLRHRMGA